MSSSLLNTLLERFGKRYEEALHYVPFIDVVVTRDSGLEVTGIVSSDRNEYGCHVESGAMMCGCMDFFVRRRVCKHIIGTVLRAVHLRLITEDEALTLLTVKKDEV